MTERCGLCFRQLYTQLKIKNRTAKEIAGFTYRQLALSNSQPGYW